LLAHAVAENLGESDLAQLRAQIAYGDVHLLVWEGEDRLGVAVVEFKQYPNFRSLHVMYAAGEDVGAALEELKPWADARGASKIECWCGDAQARLFKRSGFREAYKVMRVDV